MILVRVIASSPALRAGLRSLLAGDREITVVGEGDTFDNADSGGEGVDVMIIAPASAEARLEPTSALRMPRATLYLTNEAMDARLMASRAPPATGVLPLDAGADELLAAVHALAVGLVVGAARLMRDTPEGTTARGPLTDREGEVLALLARGLANKQIALALGISEHTVKFHVSSIYAKLDATNRTQAVREGLRNGLIAL